MVAISAFIWSRRCLDAPLLDLQQNVSCFTSSSLPYTQRAVLWRIKSLSPLFYSNGVLLIFFNVATKYFILAVSCGDMKHLPVDMKQSQMSPGMSFLGEIWRKHLSSTNLWLQKVAQFFFFIHINLSKSPFTRIVHICAYLGMWFCVSVRSTVLNVWVCVRLTVNVMLYVVDCSLCHKDFSKHGKNW